MNRHVWIDGTKVTLAPSALLGQGGEAEVYDLGDGRVVKWWKPAEHPDFDGLPDAQQMARRRLAEQPAKLRALPGNLPRAVVAPCGFALAKRNGAVVGYVMPRVTGVALHELGEPRWRRDHPIAGADVVAALLALHDAIAGLHRAGVVIGDCNDQNVLVDGTRVHLIDVDSYQYAGFVCSMFCERFVDPRLCDQQLVPARPHDTDSDWFAFAAIALRTLLGVGPWGGVLRSCAASSQRGLRRLSVLRPDIVYPRAARPLAILPDDLLDTFRAIFERDQRGVFPRDALARLHLRACASCGDEHARVRCPTCQAQSRVPAAIVHGRLRYQQIAMPAALPRTVWLDGTALVRRTRVGVERIGTVLAGQTRIWIGAQLGVGFYRAGGYAVGFVFHPDRGVLDDRVAMPKIRGRLVSAHAVIAEDRAWLFLIGSDVTTCVVIGRDSSVLATTTLDEPWLAGIAGACATGAHLFVPTDEGITRVEVIQQTVTATRVFAETAPLVTTTDRLALSPLGIDVIRRRDAIRLQLT